MDPEGSSRKAHPRRESSVAAKELAATLRPADGPAPTLPEASASVDVAAAAADDGLKAAAL